MYIQVQALQIHKYTYYVQGTYIHTYRYMHLYVYLNERGDAATPWHGVTPGPRIRLQVGRTTLARKSWEVDVAASLPRQGHRTAGRADALARDPAEQSTR